MPKNPHFYDGIMEFIFTDFSKDTQTDNEKCAARILYKLKETALQEKGKKKVITTHWLLKYFIKICLKICMAMA